MPLRLRQGKEDSFSMVVAAEYEAGNNTYQAALMSWSTYQLLVNLSIAAEPITPMSYRVLCAADGPRHLVGDDMPSDVIKLPQTLPVAVKSQKVGARELCRVAGISESRLDIWHNSMLVPTLIELGLTEKKFDGLRIEVDIPTHVIRIDPDGRYITDY